MSDARRVADVVAVLDRRAPFEKAADWDPVGLQIGDPGAQARSLAVCHEVTEAVVAAVEADPVDLLIAYHPLLFRPTRSLVAGATPEGRALRLARAGVGLAIVHTSFDVAAGGAAEALADALDLEQLRGFAPLFPADALKLVTFLPADDAERVLDAVVAAGGARIGNYSHCSWRTEGLGTFFAREGSSPVVGRHGELNREPEVRLEFTAPVQRETQVVAALVAAHPYEEPAFDVYRRRAEAGMLGRIGRVEPGTVLGDMVRRVRDALGEPPLRVAGALERPVESVAVLPGSGSDFLHQAAAAGADLAITGDIAHHRAREALDRGLMLLDPGHAATERPGLERLFTALAAEGLAVRSLLELDPDPWAVPDGISS